MYFYNLLLIIVLFFAGCENDTKKQHICPTCNMPIIQEKFTAKAQNNIFDDIGCMVLWAKKNNVDLLKVSSKVFASDTQRFIDSKNAFYTFDEKTPMNYGFNAYEHKKDNSIDFNEVILRVLRGETMVNPKIRKKILGY
jgi:hypothetical protein